MEARIRRDVVRAEMAPHTIQSRRGLRRHAQEDECLADELRLVLLPWRGRSAEKRVAVENVRTRRRLADQGRVLALEKVEDERFLVKVAGGGIRDDGVIARRFGICVLQFA